MNATELRIHRAATLRFIDARPTSLALRGQNPVKTGDGVRMEPLAARATQVGRLIEVNATGGPQPATDGGQRKDVFELLLPWDGHAGLNDYWVDPQGIRWEVTGILPSNEYELRVEVTRYGETGQ